GGDAGLRRLAVAAPVRRADSAGASDHPRRHQPDHDDGAGNGGDRLHDRRGWPRLPGAPGHRPPRSEPRPVCRAGHRSARNHLRPDHAGLWPPTTGPDRRRGGALMDNSVPDSNAAIVMRGLTKIFGPYPEMALAMLREGRSKTEVQAETGHVVGLDNVSL